MSDEPITKRDFRGPALIASGVAVLLMLGAGWDFLKSAIVEDLAEEQSRATAETNLHMACWAKATQRECSMHLSEYFYCKYGKTSKDQVVK